jgi:hypothetical protein
MNQINHKSHQKLSYRINAQILDHQFTDYWDIFVLKHQHPINIALHVIGILFFYSLLFAIGKSKITGYF